MGKHPKLNSNNGWQQIEFRFIREFIFNDIQHSLFEVRFENKFWERETLLKVGCEELVSDRSLTLSQVILPNSKWLELESLLSQWKETQQLFSLLLTSINGLEIVFELKVSEELISSSDKLILEIKIRDAKTKIVWKMVIDQSSILYL